MLVHVKTPHTEVNIKGEVSEGLMKALRTDFGDHLDITDDDARINPFECDWFQETKARMTPGDRLRIDRENAGWSQSVLGKKIGSRSRAFISDLENGRAAVSTETARTLAALFNRSPDRYI